MGWNQKLGNRYPPCLSLFSVAITEYLRLGIYKEKKFILADSSGCWEVQDWSPKPGEVLVLFNLWQKVEGQVGVCGIEKRGQLTHSLKNSINASKSSAPMT